MFYGKKTNTQTNKQARSQIGGLVMIFITCQWTSQPSRSAELFSPIKYTA